MKGLAAKATVPAVFNNIFLVLEEIPFPHAVL
jgi:hypothetical protein